MGLGLRHSPLEWDPVANVFDFGGAGIIGAGNFSNRYYVNPNVTNAGNGLSWRSPFKYIHQALYVATTRGDEIFLAAGDYDEDRTLDITTQGLRIVGYGGNMHHNRAMIYSGSAGHLMTINAHEVEICGVGFSVPDDTFDAIRIATTTAAYKTWIRHCRFDGWATGEHAIYAGGTQDCPDTLIEYNTFRSWATGCVRVNATRTRVHKNMFHVAADTFGIEHIPVGGARPDNTYVDNDFSGVANASTTGILFTGAPSDGTIFMSRNNFAGTFNTEITKIAAIGGVNNYVSSGTTGGTLIDTVT